MLKINTDKHDKKKKKNNPIDFLKELQKSKPLTFSLKYEPKFIELLDSKLAFKENNYYVEDKVPLFTIRADEPQTTYKNMQLVKINIKCIDCEFEERITKLHLDKLLRQQKPLNANNSKRHAQETNHKMIVTQRYEQYKPPKLLVKQ